MPRCAAITSILVIGAALAGCQPAEAGRPSRDQILAQATECGFSAENIEFSVDEEGVTNAVIRPTEPVDERFRERIECVLTWGARNGAAIGFDFTDLPENTAIGFVGNEEFAQ